MGLLDDLAKRKAAEHAARMQPQPTAAKVNPLDNLIKPKVENEGQVRADESLKPSVTQGGNVVPSILSRLAVKPAGNHTPAAAPVEQSKPIPASVETKTPVPPPVTVTEKVTDASVVIPENIPEEQKIAVAELKTMMDYLITNIDDKDLVGPVVRNILAKLQANPDLCVFVPNLGMNQVVRGIRSSFKFEARKSAEKTEKKAVKATKVSAVKQAFSDMDFGKLD